MRSSVVGRVSEMAGEPDSPVLLQRGSSGRDEFCKADVRELTNSVSHIIRSSTLSPRVVPVLHFKGVWVSGVQVV